MIISNKAKYQGYTLIEILIVMIIISIVGTASVMLISRNKNTRLESLAKQITNIISLTEEQAMLQPAVLGFSVSQNSFQVYQYQEPTREQENAWLALSDSVLGKHSFPTSIAITVKIQGEAVEPKKNQPQIIISTNGDITPFVILIGEKGKTPRYQITGEENGTLTQGVVKDENP